MFLFVYGTLRSDVGGTMNGLLADGARRVGRATAPGRLYDVGPYPAAVPPLDSSDRLIGELHALHPARADELMTALDRYEGFDPNRPAASLYVRTRVEVAVDDGTRVDAWIYYYNQPVGALARIPSGDWARR